jgi:pentose-5-phosphate-3-epimerase
MTYRIAQSLLHADFARLGDEACAVVEAGAYTVVAGSAIVGQPSGQAVIAALRREPA